MEKVFKRKIVVRATNINVSPFLVDAQEWLNDNYPLTGKKEIKFLDLSSKNLIGHLLVEDWPQLETIYCENNKLTSLTLINCLCLKTIWVDGNHLTKLVVTNCGEINDLSVSNNRLINWDFLTNLNREKLNYLDIDNNNFPQQDLTSLGVVFSQFSNLVRLVV